jgi:hypothetical protein
MTKRARKNKSRAFRLVEIVVHSFINEQREGIFDKIGRFHESEGEDFAFRLVEIAI